MTRSRAACRLVMFASVVALLLAIGPSPAIAQASFRSGPGIYALDASVDPPPGLATSLTIAPFTTDASKPGNLTGRLTDVEGNPVAGAGITVEAQLPDSSWEATATATTDAGGSFLVVGLMLKRNTAFRAVYDGWEGSYEGTASLGSTATFTPTISWVTTPAAAVDVPQKLRMKLTADVPGHLPCSGVVRLEQLLPSTAYVQRKAFVVEGKLDPVTGNVVFEASTYVPTAGDWRVFFDIDADGVHGAATSEPKYLVVGATTLSASASKSDIKAGSAVTVSGYLRNARTGRGLGDRLVSLYDGDTKVATHRTSSKGKVTFTPHPRCSASYRLVFAGTSTAHSKRSKTRSVRTSFTLSGRSAGHFTSRRVWIPQGGPRALIVRIDGKRQSVAIHWSSGKLCSAHTLARSPGTFDLTFYEGLRWSKGHYYHFKVTGSGYFKITVRN